MPPQSATSGANRVAFGCILLFGLAFIGGGESADAVAAKMMADLDRGEWKAKA